MVLHLTQNIVPVITGYPVLRVKSVTLQGLELRRTSPGDRIRTAYFVSVEWSRSSSSSHTKTNLRI
jgi:hypothetical protein